jgi:hypothetical protein
MRPTHVMDSNLLYSKSAELSLNLVFFRILSYMNKRKKKKKKNKKTPNSPPRQKK